MNRRWARWGLPALALALVVYTVGLRRPGVPLSETRFLMDTFVTVSVWGVAGERGEEVFRKAFDALDAVDREMARQPGTALWRLDEEGGGSLSPALGAVVGSSLAWARRTGGAFDPTVAPLLDLWDFPAGAREPPAPEAVRQTLSRVGWARVRWEPSAGRVDLGGTALDVGGIAKGYAIDRAAEALRGEGVGDFIVNAGGDLYVSGSKGGVPWRVGIQHPREPESYLRVVQPRGGALVTSGDYERYFLWEGERYHHILDPRTGYPSGRCRSVTVWAPTALDADALATAVFVLGPEQGLALLASQPRAEGLLVDAEGGVHESPGFSDAVPEAVRR